MEGKRKTEKLNDNLKKLAEISDWFSGRNEIDIELGLEKVKEAAALIKSSKEKLDKLENEFAEIEKEIAGDGRTPKPSIDQPV